MPISNELRERINKKELTSKDYTDLYALSHDESEDLNDRILAGKIAWEQAATRLEKVRIIEKQCHDYYIKLAHADSVNRNFNEMKEMFKTIPDSVVDALIAKLGNKLNKLEER